MSKIPIKGYATFDPLKHCMIGSGFKTEWFSEFQIYKNNKIMDPLKRIAEETEEDYQKLDTLLKSLGVQTYRPKLDFNAIGSLKNIYRPPVCPRDPFAVVGETFYAVNVPKHDHICYSNILPQIDQSKLFLDNTEQIWEFPLSTANIVRVGKDIWWDIKNLNNPLADAMTRKYKKRWEEEGFRVHMTNTGYHLDGMFCVVKPGCIVSVFDEVPDYATNFPGWDVLYIPDQSWDKVSPFIKVKDKVRGRWWLRGEEDNDQLIEFVNTWLNNWVGYVEETVFDVNMLSIDKETIICNNYNKEVFEHFKKHKVEPIIFNFRHRYFWDGGIHCMTQDFYREGTQEDYFG